MRLVLGKGGVRPQEGRNLAPRVYSTRDAPAVGLVPAAVSHSDSTPKLGQAGKRSAASRPDGTPSELAVVARHGAREISILTSVSRVDGT